MNRERTQAQLVKIIQFATRREFNLHANLEGANLRGADLSYANLLGADLYRADLEGADLRNADLRNADLLGTDLRGADLRGANLYRANLRGADLEGANLTGANLTYANLTGANLRGADLYRADLRGADLEGADLTYASLSDAIGLLSASDYLEANFEFQSDGSMIVYKTFNRHYAPNTNWLLEPNSIITETCNPCRVTDCGSGINVAKRDYDGFGNGYLWKCIIKPQWLGGVVVPYHTDGKIRCERLMLIEIVS